MLEFLNNLFKIDNKVSVPILISLIVFITGGLVKIIIRTFINYNIRLQSRKTFRNVINEIIRKCKMKTDHTKQFYPTLTITHNDTWPLKYTRITYLELAFQQDFNSIYKSFRILFLFRNKNKLRIKAFNKTWAVLENLKFYENRIIIDFENFAKKFSNHESAYYKHLEDLRQENDKLYQPFKGKKINKAEFPENEVNYLVKRDEIFCTWQNLDESTRRNRVILFKNIIEPLYNHNFQNQDVKHIVDQNNILLAAKHEYEQMVKILETNEKLFYSYFRSYKTSYKVLEKCLILLK